MFISIAQSIKSRFSNLPTDETDFTVVAMRTLLSYTFTTLHLERFLCLICGRFPCYPTHIPQIDAFNPDDLWILENLIDMFPYLCGVLPVKLQEEHSMWITGFWRSTSLPELDKIAAEENLEMFKRHKEIENNLASFLAVAEAAIISILKMYSFSSDNSETFKRVPRRFWMIVRTSTSQRFPTSM